MKLRCNYVSFSAVCGLISRLSSTETVTRLSTAREFQKSRIKIGCYLFKNIYPP